jgi:formyl-CoA transferase
MGALMALRHRDVTGGRWNGQTGEACKAGQGQMVDVALYEAVFNMMESLVPEYDQAGVVRERTGGALPGIVPSNTYTTADGENIVIAGNGDAIFKRLMSAIGRDDMANDPQLANNAGRVPRTQEIDDAIQQWCSSQQIDTALAALQAADVPVSKIYSDTGTSGVQNLLGARHDARPAVSCAPDVRAASVQRWHAGQATDSHAQAIRNPRQHPLDRAGVG